MHILQYFKCVERRWVEVDVRVGSGPKKHVLQRCAMRHTYVFSASYVYISRPKSILFSFHRIHGEYYDLSVLISLFYSYESILGVFFLFIFSLLTWLLPLMLLVAITLIASSFWMNSILWGLLGVLTLYLKINVYWVMLILVLCYFLHFQFIDSIHFMRISFAY